MSARQKPIVIPQLYNAFVYAAFTLTGIIYWFVEKGTMNSVVYMGIALVFDPFDQQMRWSARPLWQRSWLVIHLVLLLGIFLVNITGKSTV